MEVCKNEDEQGGGGGAKAVRERVEVVSAAEHFNSSFNVTATPAIATPPSRAHTLTHRGTLWAVCDRQLVHVLCSVFSSSVVK